MYLLEGRRYPCYLNLNPKTDSRDILPDRFNGTDYMYDLCGVVYTCEGTYITDFEWVGADEYGANGEWEFVCDWRECLDCD